MTRSQTRPQTRFKKGLALAARAGYIAKGIVYLLIGGLPALVAAGLGGDSAGSKEAINQLVTRPFGDIMLGLLGVGLLAYALWRLLQSLLDTEEVGLGLKGAGTRLAFLMKSAP